MSGSWPSRSNTASALVHVAAMGAPAMVRMRRHRCNTEPSVAYRFAPKAWPPMVELALAMPTMMELPVTFPSVVARAAAARGSAPRCPTKATEVSDMTRLHTMLSDTGSARLSWPRASSQKGAGASSASSAIAPLTLGVSASSPTSPSSRSTWYRVGGAMPTARWKRGRRSFSPSFREIFRDNS